MRRLKIRGNHIPKSLNNKKVFLWVAKMLFYMADFFVKICAANFRPIFRDEPQFSAFEILNNYYLIHQKRKNNLLTTHQKFSIQSICVFIVLFSIFLKTNFLFF